MRPPPRSKERFTRSIVLSAPIVRFAGLPVWVDVPLSELKSVKNLDRELWAVDASSSVSS